MASKRAASKSPSRRGPKRSRFTKLIPVVVDALADSQPLSEDLRTLLKLSLPVTLNVNKSDRGAWEHELVAQAEKCLATVQKDIEQAQKAALGKQNEVIAPAEHKKRTSAKQAAEASLEAAKNKLEASKAARKARETAVHDAKSGLKTAEKEASSAEKDLAQNAGQKAALDGVLAGEFASLRDGTSAGAAGKKAVDKVLKLGKDYSLDSTLLQTFPMTCKKPAANRSEFESMMFTQLEAQINSRIQNFAAKCNAAEAVKAQKDAAVGNAKAALDSAEAALVVAGEEVNSATTAQKDVAKEVSRADSHLYQIWDDMKVVCDAQDKVANNLKYFKDDVLTAFKELKEKEPEPEPVQEPEPAAEDSAAAPAPDAAAA